MQGNLQAGKGGTLWEEVVMVNLSGQWGKPKARGREKRREDDWIIGKAQGLGNFHLGGVGRG